MQLMTELNDPPGDGVSSLRFASHADLLLTSSWDGSVRLYDTQLNSCRASFKQRMPVLDAAFVVRAHFPVSAPTHSAPCRTRTLPCQAAWTRLCGCTT